MSSRTTPRNLPGIELRESAKALIEASHRVLLVKERHGDGSVFWTLPGGGLETGENHSEALCRELGEELRCLATVCDPLTEFWYAHRSRRNTLSRCKVFRCQLRSAVMPNSREGIRDHRWVRPTDLPPQTLLLARQTIENATDGNENVHR